jgi:hypothetical protein
LSELEKRFDAYRSLQEEEFTEIKSLLVQISEDIQVLARYNSAIPLSSNNDITNPSDKDGDESTGDLPILAL